MLFRVDHPKYVADVMHPEMSLIVSMKNVIFLKTFALRGILKRAASKIKRFFVLSLREIKFAKIFIALNK